MPVPFEFFVSYNRDDRDWAQWIAWQLRASGYRTVEQEWDYVPGGRFVLESHAAAARSARTIVLLSPRYVVKELAQPEWRDLFMQEAEGSRHRLLPVRVARCHLPPELGALPYVDLVGLDEPSARERLMQGVVKAWALPVAVEVDPSRVQGPLPPEPMESIDWSAFAYIERPLFPGVPTVWNVPHDRNANFTGRRRLLAHVRRAFRAGQAVALTQTIVGLGSVGKTQVAIEYAYRYRDRYSVIWWVRAEHPASLAADYAALADPLDLPQKSQPDQRQVIAAVRAWLTRNPRWLLILDNADNPEHLRDYLPDTLEGHVLATSRTFDWAGVAESIPVEVFDRDESVKFLLDRTAVGEAGGDRAAADELAGLIGDLPLGLAHAVGYVNGSGESLRDYIERYRRRCADLHPGQMPPLGWEDTIATTLSLAVDSVQSASAAAADLLTLCAFFAPDNVPFWLLTDPDGQLPAHLTRTLSDPISFTRAVNILSRFGLAILGADALSLHRLVQSVVRDRLPPEAKKHWAGHAAIMAAAGFPRRCDDPDNWPHCGALLTHARAAADFAAELGVAKIDADALRERIAVYLFRRGQ